MRSGADVVIIGAGIQGLSAAYHLNKLGVRDVVVVEMASIGAGSSGSSAALLTLHVGTEEVLALAKHSFPAYMQFEDELGVDPGYDPIGILIVGGDTVAQQEREAARVQRGLGIQSDMLTADEVKAMVPPVNVSDIVFGLWGPEDGVIDPHMIMQGYASGARRLGTEINQGVRATGLRVSGRRVVAVETTHGPIATRWVVNAAGTLADEVGRWAGVEIPIDNRRRNIFITKPFPQIPDGSPFVYDGDVGWYYRKEGPGVLMGMGTEEDAPASGSVNWDYLPRVVEYAMHRVPVLAEAEILRGWSGIRSLTPDGKPILGPVDGLEGFVNSCGWGGEGVTTAPAGGQLVAEIIRDGKTSLPIEPFLLSRFSV